MAIGGHCRGSHPGPKGQQPVESAAFIARSAKVEICCIRNSMNYPRNSRDCAISSVVERLLHTQEVAGSNPASRTTFFPPL
jgi:hypothetical protein